MKAIIKTGIVSLLFCSFCFISCNKDSLKGCEEHSVAKCNEEANKTNIRIVNSSKYDFCNVILNPSAGIVNYGIIGKGSSTCYRSFDKAYNYAYVSLKIGDKTFTLSPIDYVGEPELGSGKFTYTIDVLNYNSGTLSIEASKN